MPARPSPTLLTTASTGPAESTFSSVAPVAWRLARSTSWNSPGNPAGADRARPTGSWARPASRSAREYPIPLDAPVIRVLLAVIPRPSCRQLLGTIVLNYLTANLAHLDRSFQLEVRWVHATRKDL